MRTCSNCNKPIKKAVENNGLIFCCTTCFAQYYLKNRPETPERNCALCNKELKFQYISKGEHYFCGMDCMNAFRAAEHSPFLGRILKAHYKGRKKPPLTVLIRELFKAF